MFILVLEKFERLNVGVEIVQKVPGRDRGRSRVWEGGYLKGHYVVGRKSRRMGGVRKD